MLEEAFRLAFSAVKAAPEDCRAATTTLRMVSSRGEWRTQVRDLDINLQYSFTCSICNSAEDPPGVGSFSSRSLHSALVRPVVEAPQSPDIMFLEWSFDAPAPTVRIKVQTPYPEEVWCFATHGNDIQMEGYAVVPPGAATEQFQQKAFWAGSQRRSLKQLLFQSRNQ